MNQIPFPNPHDADALNDYLDALVSGEPARPGDAVQSTAQEIHTMAKTAPSTIAGHTPHVKDGAAIMHAQALSTPPISNRTRRAQLPKQEPSRLHVWLSGGLVAALLISMISYAWLNGPGGENPRNNLAYAPQVASPTAEEPLNPEDAPWIADLNAEDCQAEEYTRDELIEIMNNATSPTQQYGVSGPAAPEDAATVNDTYREMRSCESGYAAAHYWTDAQIASAPRNLTDENLSELADLQAYFEPLYPQQFMVTAVDVQIDDKVQTEWDERASLGFVGNALPLSTRINPEWGVELSDGRIAFPATLIYAANDPAIVANGLPANTPNSTVVMVFSNLDGNWKYDDSLPLCLANCEWGIGNPLDPSVETWAQPYDTQACTADPLSDADFRAAASQAPDLSGDSQTITGPADSNDAEAAVATVRMYYGCLANNQPSSARSQLSSLGLVSPVYGSAIMLSQEEIKAVESSDVDLVIDLGLNHTDLIQTAVSTDYQTDYREYTPATQFLSIHRNDDYFYSNLHMARADGAFVLEDGRVIVPMVNVIDMNDRGAVQYGGASWYSELQVSVLRNEDGMLKLDATFFISTGLYIWQYVERASQTNANPVATPDD